MEIKESIFRAYDIRGIFNTELYPDLVTKIGMAFGTYLGGEGRVCLARDGRTSSRIIEQALVAGITSTGVDVEIIGLVPIPIANYWTWKNDFSAGVYITASHNPAEYNGIRFRHPDGTGYTLGNDAIKEILLEEDFILADWDLLGRSYNEDSSSVIDNYVDFIMEHWTGGETPLKIVIDPGNGVAGLVAPDLFNKLGMDVITINAQVDGTFPGRPSEPSKENINDLCALVEGIGADVGLAYDGDSDRCAFVDEKGKAIQVEKVGVIIARELLEEYDGPVISTVSASMLLEQEIEEAGGEVISVRVGDAFVAQAIKENDGIFGVEDSAHFFLPLSYNFDDPILTSMYLVDILTRSNKTFGELLDEVPSYPKDKLKFDCSDDIKFQVIDAVVEHYSQKEGDFELVTLDGAKIIYPEGWGLVRCSNTQPSVRITVEAQTEERLKELMQEFQEVFLEEMKIVSSELEFTIPV